jgi:hypothetical protein
MNVNEFCELYIPTDCRDEAKKELRKMLRLYEEEKEELKHESDYAVMLEEDLEE